MKFLNQFLIITLFIALSDLTAQSISFVTPQNGQTYKSTGLESTETTIPVQFMYGYQQTQYPPRYSLSMYAKLITDEGVYYSTDEGGIKQWHHLTPGTHTWILELYEFFVGDQAEKTAYTAITFYVKHTLSAVNNFSSGSINIDGSPESSGSVAYKYVNDNLALGAIDQSSGGISYVWNTSGTNNSNWGRRGKDDGSFSPINGATSRNYSYSVASNDNGATLQAGMKYNCNVTFQNEFSGGTIQVGSTQTTSPSSGHTVVDSNPITATAINQTIDGIQRTFSSWTGGSTSATTTFYPDQVSASYTAYFTYKPVWTSRDLSTNSTPGQYITVSWDEHPSSDVEYKIYRKIKHNGVMGSEVFRATVNHGTTSWTDNLQIADGQTTDLVYYDVRAYHTTYHTYSDADYDATVYMFTEANIQTANDSNTDAVDTGAPKPVSQKEEITETTIGNFPNPFNPTTVINYKLAEAGQVLLKVYDTLGKEVATLVNDTKPAGSYNVSFNGANLPSGVYIYTLQTNNQAITQKMLLMK